MSVVADRRIIRAPRGSQLSCKNWGAEAAYRMLQNNLDPDVAENPDELIVYGGIGKAARNWEAFDAILRALLELEGDETLLIQSGKPVGILKTHAEAPRVLIANGNLVPKWANWDVFHELDQKGLIMFGQMTAGSWIYIGTQGIVQGTYETFAACGRKHFSESQEAPLAGRIVVSAGLGGMGGAQPLAAKLCGAAFLGVDVDSERIAKRLQTGYLDVASESLSEAWDFVNNAAANRTPVSVGLVGNIAAILPEMASRGMMPHILTDQTSAHDPLHGYRPIGLNASVAATLRESDKPEYLRLVHESVRHQYRALLDFKDRGAVVFDYGNNLRTLAVEAGVARAFEVPGFVPEYIRPMFCEGRGPFRWVALSGDPDDIAVTDRAILELFPDNASVQNWLRKGSPQIRFQGLPARICWLGHGERTRAGLALNELVRTGQVSAPIVIGRDHLDAGSVASPLRETEGMRDGSDAISDWPILNALANAVNGATWVSFHHGGGVGMGYSQHAGVVIVADGSDQAAARITRTLTGDTTLGVLRHADAGYSRAREVARQQGIRIPK